MIDGYSDLRKRIADFEISLLLRIGAPSGVYRIYGECAFEPLIKAMAEPDFTISKRASEIIVRMGNEITPALIDALKDPDKRELAVRLIVKIGINALPRLIESLDKLDGATRQIAEKIAYDIVMTNLGEDSEVKVVPAETKASMAGLARDTAERRSNEYVIWTPKIIHPHIRSALPILIRMLQNDDQEVREKTSTVIGQIARDEDGVINFLPEIIEAFSRTRDIHVLQMMCMIARVKANHPNVVNVIPQLLSAIKDEPDPKISTWIIVTIEIVARAHPQDQNVENASRELVGVWEKTKTEELRGGILELFRARAEVSILELLEVLARIGVGNTRNKIIKTIELVAGKQEIDLSLVGESLARHVARVSETGSPEEVLAAQNEAAESYSRIAAAASKRMNNSVEMAGEMLRPSIRPITPRGWNPGMLRQQAMERAQGMRKVQMHGEMRVALQ